MQKQPFSFSARVKSFGYALKGLRFFLVHEHNARIHLFATALVTGLGFVVHLTSAEWILLLLTIASVWVTEVINTAIEQLCNAVSPEKHPKIGLVKDLAAGAVLITACIAVIIGLIIFLPKIIQLC